MIDKLLLNWDTPDEIFKTDYFDEKLIISTRRSKNQLIELLGKDCLQKSNIIIRESNYPTVNELKQFRLLTNQKNSYESIICIGGGSTLDFGKLVISDVPEIGNIFFTNRLIFLPTNVGSGAEVTNFATLWDLDKKSKTSIQLSESVHVEVHYVQNFYSTLTNNQLEIGMFDALGHSFDSFFSIAANDHDRFLAKQNIFEICEIMNKFYDNSSLLKNNLIALQRLSASAGMCIRNTKSSLSHALSYALTLEFGVEHGLAVAMMMQRILKEYKTKLINLHSDSQVILDLINKVLDQSMISTKHQELFMLCHLNSSKLIDCVDINRLNNFVIPIDLENCEIFFK